MIVVGQTSAVNTPSVASTATALSANANRMGFKIQNVGTNPLYVLLGSGASTTVYHEILKAATGATVGDGGIFSMNIGTVYTGIVTVAGTSPSYVVLELGN